MKAYIDELRKHFRIYGRLMKNSLMRQLEYPSNFLISLIVETFFMISKLMYVLIAYRVGKEIHGVSASEMKLFVGTFMLLTATYTAFFADNLYGMSDKVKKGDLDLMFVKPVSTQFITTLRTVNFAMPIPNIVIGIILVISSWVDLGLGFSISGILIYVFLLACGTCITYSIFLLPNLLCFYMVKINSVTEITDRMWDFNSMPMSIYSKWMQRIGTFVIPVFFITNFPVMGLLGELDGRKLLWAFIAPLIFFWIVRRVWKISVKKYSSAGG